MEAVDGELQKVAKAQDLVFDVLRLVAQSMCFSEAQKASLEAGPVRQKVDMMLGSSEFAPYRQAALSVEAVKRRVEMVQKERSDAATKRAEQLKRERDKKRQARTNKKRTPIQEAADRLEVDEDMLRAVAAAMTMSEAQVDAACSADPTAGEKLRGVREGAAFGEIREACVKLGLVDEASKEMKAALKEDEDSLDDSQLDAAERSMGMSADAVERLPDDAKRAVKALRGDPAFAGVRAAVEARRKRRAGGASKPKSKPKSTPKAPDPTPPPAPPARPTAGSPPPREPRAASASASVTSASASVDSVRASPASSPDPLAGATRPREDLSGSSAGSVDDDRRVDDSAPLEPSRALSRSARGLPGPDDALAPRLIDSDPRGSLGRAARRVAFPTLPRVVAGSAGARPSALAARLERAWDVLDVSLARRLDWSVALADADADAGAGALADAVAAWEFAAAAVDARADAASRLERRIAEANATRAASASGSGGDGVLDCGAGKVSAEEARAFRDAEDAAANVYRAAALLASAVGGGRAETFESTLEFLLRFPLHA